MPTKNEILRRVHWAIEAARSSAKTRQGRSYIEDMSVHTCGVEDGYVDTEHEIMVLGNWNPIWAPYNEGGHVIDDIAPRLGNVLELIGVDVGWSDCWEPCVECCKLVRTEPTSYGWKPNYATMDGQTICYECLDDAEYLESLEGQERSINTLTHVDPGECGYHHLMDFVRGMHYGQDSDPRLIAKLLIDAGFRRWIFHMDSKGQFDMDFSVWLHEEEADRDDGEGLILAKRVLEQGQTDGPSVAAAMERGLKEASRQADELRRQGATGPIVSKVSPTSVSSKEVSPDDFVEGKALD